MKTNNLYVVRGDVRGTLSRHRTLNAAVASLRRDQRVCQSLGGGAYSDCEIEHEDGSPLTEEESEAIYSMD